MVFVVVVGTRYGESLGEIDGLVNVFRYPSESICSNAPDVSCEQDQ